ncbi:hypothetical protein JCM11251_004770 [Rhodosporidiobolus azoricus]
MAAVYSKGLPQPVHQLAQGSQHTLHRDYSLPATSSHSTAAFRSDASSSSDEFGSFAAQSHYSSLPAPSLPGVFNVAWPSARLAGGGGTSTISTTRNSSHDGAEVAAFLSDASVSMFDAIDGHWERELFEKQNEPWRKEMEEATPADPFASATARATRDALADSVKGKGKAVFEAGMKGDMSPTSSELLSSLSSLDLSSRAYLRTLVSLPPDLALEDYFAHGLYTDDVYGLPDGVKRLFEKVGAGKQDGADKVEEGRMKAVRRLGMVMQHLRASEEAELAQEAGRMSLEDGMQDVGGSFSTKWVPKGEYSTNADRRFAHQPMNQNEAVFGSSSFATAAHQQQQPFAAFQPTAMAQQSQPVVFPSSLSSSAYITMSPTSQASISTLTPQPAHQSSSPPLSSQSQHEDPSSAPLPSFASYFADQHARMLTNDRGSRGVDFTRKLDPAQRMRVGIEAGVRGDAWREELRVTEGRTH